MSEPKSDLIAAITQPVAANDLISEIPAEGIKPPAEETKPLENGGLQPPPENLDPAPPASEPKIATLTDAPLNEVAQPVTAEQVIEKRGRGRPPGSKTRNRSNQPAVNGAIEFATQSEIPGIGSGAQPLGDAQPISEGVAIPATSAPAPIDYGPMASMLFDMSTNSLAMVFGPEWKPKDETERTIMVDSIGAYLRTKEVKDIPPGLALTIVLVSYSAARIQHDNTKTKLQRGWLWLKSKLPKRKKNALAIAPTQNA